jgi:hypothetical protein
MCHLAYYWYTLAPSNTVKNLFSQTPDDVFHDIKIEPPLRNNFSTEREFLLALTIFESIYYTALSAFG